MRRTFSAARLLSLVMLCSLALQFRPAVAQQGSEESSVASQPPAANGQPNDPFPDDSQRLKPPVLDGKPASEYDVYTRMYQPRNLVTLRGPVVSARLARLNDDQAALVVRINSAVGLATIVLGPTDYLLDEELDVRIVDVIRVTGAWVRINGRITVIARTVSKEEKTLELRDQQGRPIWGEAKDQEETNSA